MAARLGRITSTRSSWLARGAAVTRLIFAAATVLAIALQAAPRAERAPHVAALALTGGQHHHYTIGARVRPLLFWVGKDDVGDAVIARKRDSDCASYALLIGTDPERTPRGINRWGYLAEEVRGAEATVVGLMTESNEESVDQAEKNLRAEGDRTFNVIRASVADGEARSVVTSVAAPSTVTLRQVDAVLELAARKGVDGKPRVVPLPSGGRPGFLSALADVLHEQASTVRSTGKVRSTEPTSFVYHGKVYQLRATSSRLIGSARVGENTYDHLVGSQFQIKNIGNGEVSEFSMTYAADGPLAELPISVTYRPRWWMEIQLTLDDTRPGPLPPSEITR
jgi:hypothetical protein